MTSSLNTRHVVVGIAAVLAMSLLAACGSNDAPRAGASSVSPTATSSAKPTSTPTTAPTPNVEPAAAVNAAIDKTLASTSFQMTTLNVEWSQTYPRASCIQIRADQSRQIVEQSYVGSSADPSVIMAEQGLDCDSFGPGYGDLALRSNAVFIWHEGDTTDPILWWRPVSVPFDQGERWMTGLSELQWQVRNALKVEKISDSPASYRFTVDPNQTKQFYCWRNESCANRGEADRLTVTLDSDGRVANVVRDFTDRAAAFAALGQQEQAAPPYVVESKMVFSSYDNAADFPSPVADTDPGAADAGLWVAHNSDPNAAPAATMLSLCRAMEPGTPEMCEPKLKLLGLDN